MSDGSNNNKCAGLSPLLLEDLQNNIQKLEERLSRAESMTAKIQEVDERLSSVEMIVNDIRSVVTTIDGKVSALEGAVKELDLKALYAREYLKALSTQMGIAKRNIEETNTARRKWATGFYPDAIVNVLKERGKKSLYLKEFEEELHISRARLMEFLPVIREDERLTVEQEEKGWRRITIRLNK